MHEPALYLDVNKQNRVQPPRPGRCAEIPADPEGFSTQVLHAALTPFGADLLAAHLHGNN